MTYAAFKETVRATLAKTPEGLTWKELREATALPYDRPCPNWTARLEREIHLRRRKSPGRGNALVWTLE